MVYPGYVHIEVIKDRKYRPIVSKTDVEILDVGRCWFLVGSDIQVMPKITLIMQNFRRKNTIQIPMIHTWTQIW